MTTAVIRKQMTKVTATEMAIAEATWDPAVPCTGSILTVERKRRTVTSHLKQKTYQEEKKRKQETTNKQHKKQQTE